MGSPLYNKKLYGTATVGTKGQVVIPAEARESMGIEPGDRLYVVGSADSGFLGLLKEAALERMVEHLTTEADNFRAIKNNTQEEKV
ncbi:MAG: AbrB/MazE/SpoVT family DNA-binding domain-containing protein [Candidatus Saccharimonadales bacterium]